MFSENTSLQTILLPALHIHAVCVYARSNFAYVHLNSPFDTVYHPLRIIKVSNFGPRSMYVIS
jgi:hypothetical protein